MNKKVKLILAIVAVVAVAAIVLAGILSSQKSDLATKLSVAEGKLKAAEL